MFVSENSNPASNLEWNLEHVKLIATSLHNFCQSERETTDTSKKIYGFGHASIEL